MKYSIKKLAQMYIKHLSNQDFDVETPKAQDIDISTYNEYEYKKLMQQFDQLYERVDSVELTENFLKGD